MPLQTSWTINRASGAGLVAAVCSLILWLAFALFGETFLFPFSVALSVCLACGLSVLAMTAIDLILRKRGPTVRPIRIFDLACGFALSFPAAAELIALMR
jgi:small neutral amino acid transporter SnatA (MarC family)